MHKAHVYRMRHASYSNGVYRWVCVLPTGVFGVFKTWPDAMHYAAQGRNV